MEILIQDNRSRFRYDLWCVFVLYLLVSGFAILTHELWGDEVHSWNIARSSPGLSDLISNSRYEGHPPLWYILLFCLSKFSQDPAAMKYLQFSICAAVAFLLLFRFHLKLTYKILILSGYFFLYEYAALSRNYAIGILLALLLCLSLAKKPGGLLYYLFLLLLSNTHFLSFILAVSFHIFLLAQHYRQAGKAWVFQQLFLGICVLLPALYFIMPSSSSGLDVPFWFRLWSKDQLFITIQAPLKALCPLPAWWEYHFWNTHALLSAQQTLPVLKFVNPLLSVLLVCLALYVISQNKRVLGFFSVNLLLTLGFALVFPLIATRYVGFIFVSFVISLLLLREDRLSGLRQITLYLLLCLQLPGALIAISKDARFPFSHGPDLRKIAGLVPEGEAIITDYWCLNYYSAFMAKPVYCLGFNTEKTFLLWDKQMTAVSQQPDIYTRGTTSYFGRSGNTHVYFMTNTPEGDIAQRDSTFFKRFDVELIAGQDDAIERYSNIYLYRIKQRP